MNRRDYLGPRERRMYERGEFFGGWEDADVGRLVLEPLERFDHPKLHEVRMGQPEWDPEEAISFHMRKAMAGAPASERIDSKRLRRALQRGRLGRKQRRCVDEMVASFRQWEMHLPFTAWGLSVYELARVVTKTYAGTHCWAPWLNLWADDPQRALPTPPRRPPWKSKRKIEANEPATMGKPRSGASRET